jgi:hypothetical protein
LSYLPSEQLSFLSPSLPLIYSIYCTAALTDLHTQLLTPLLTYSSLFLSLHSFLLTVFISPLHSTPLHSSPLSSTPLLSTVTPLHLSTARRVVCCCDVLRALHRHGMVPVTRVSTEHDIDFSLLCAVLSYFLLFCAALFL